MCGRIAALSSHPEIEERYKVEEIREELQVPSYNIAPGIRVNVVLDDGGRVLDSFKWGLVPSYSETRYPLRGKKEWNNARSDKLMSSSLYKRLLSRRRCIVPVSGFYEWLPVTKTNKLPYFIHRTDEEISGLAALWDTWKQEDGSTLKSCAIITTDANEAVSAIHDRMPVFVTRDFEDLWLDSTATDAEELYQFMRPCDAEHTEAYRVTKRVNATGFNSPECIIPSTDELQPPGEQLILNSA